MGQQQRQQQFLIITDYSAQERGREVDSKSSRDSEVVSRQHFFLSFFPFFLLRLYRD